MVHISTNLFEENGPSVYDVNYVSFNMEAMRDVLISSLENFWKCIEVNADDYVFKNNIKDINVQRKEFFRFLEGSVQQSHEIRRYSSKLRIFINCFHEDSFSNDEYFKELDSLLNDTKKNLESAEKLQAQIREIKNELVRIGEDINIYKEDIQHDLENVKSRCKDDLDKTKCRMNISGFIRNVSLALGGLGVVSGVIFLAGAGAVLGLASEHCRRRYLSQCDENRRQLENQRDELITNIAIVLSNFESLNMAIAQLIGYWEIQSTTISDLSNKLNKVKDEQNYNKLLIRVIDKNITDLESDELFSKNFCITIRTLMTRYESRCM
ncbi:19034_t:CDS:2 [Cetraspora pellucida]|uniref:19034_t:CDS:1 n=1 Tax=Cetraspora pellucida TaxID=1433469 RepID=A0A9N8ZH96_9GLOM|nr:19034_t:CDS:2 [Cetraspora pellucida]